MSKLLKLGLFFGLFFVVFSSSVLAHDESQSSSTTSEKKVKEFKMSEMKDSSKSAKDRNYMGGKEDKLMKVMPLDKKNTSTEARKVKLSEARLKTCEEREEKIGDRFERLLALGTKTHLGMDKIVERVDEFYNNVLVPQGHTLSNYDALKSDIATKKAAVRTALSEAQTSGQGFSCDSEDPKAQADAFRQDIQALMTANKAYKTSVRNFVVAVRDLAKQAKANTVSPAPDVSPVVTEEPTL